MIGWFKVGAIALVFSAVMGGVWLVKHQAAEIKDLKAQKALAVANYAAALQSVRVEHQIQTVTRTVYVKAKEAAIHVQAIDPKCADPGPLVAAWRNGLDGVRNAAKSGASDSSVSP